MCVLHPRVRSSSTNGQIQQDGKRKMAEDKENSLSEGSVWGRKTLNTHANRMAFRADSVQTCSHAFTSL